MRLLFITSEILKMKIALLNVGLIILLFFVISQIYFKMAKTETQPYQLIKREKDFAICMYPSATIAAMSMDATTYKE